MDYEKMGFTDILKIMATMTDGEVRSIQKYTEGLLATREKERREKLEKCIEAFTVAYQNLVDMGCYITYEDAKGCVTYLDTADGFDFDTVDGFDYDF